MPRLFRQSPLNGIWEGSGNIQCLDVLRAIRRSPESVDALLAELEPAIGTDPVLDRAVTTLHADLTDSSESGARRLVERIALVTQAALLTRDGDPAVARAFTAARLAPHNGLAFGTLPADVGTTRILARVLPALS